MNKKHTDDKYCDMREENFKTENELIEEEKKLLYTTSVKVTDDDDHVLLDGQDCKPCGFKFKTIVNMKAYLVTSVKGFTAIVNYSRSTLIKFIWI